MFQSISNKKIPNTKYPIQSTNYQGFTLIESLTVLFIVSLIITTFYYVFTLGSDYILEAKNRLGATALANEKMEIVRNLDYADIGTTTGIPHGNILEKESVAVNGRTYYVFTFVQYIDDPLDGLVNSATKDTIPSDYKRVRIKVAWENNINSDKAVSLISNFSPKGVETSSGGGVLSINILDNQGHGIPQAQVHITNSAAGINITTLTDTMGNVTLPGAPVGNKTYSIEVNKDGYYSVHTYPPYPTTSDFKPVDEHASCVDKSLNVKSIITDKLSNIDIATKDPFGNDIPNISFALAGGRKIGNDLHVPPYPVYDYSANLTTGSDGHKTISDRSSGIYTFTLNPSVSNYMFVEMTPGAASSTQFDLSPDTDFSVSAILADETVNSLIVTVNNSKDQSAVPGANVTLKDSNSTYDVTLTTDKYGKVFFPQALPALVAGQYSLTVSSTNYIQQQTNININALTFKTISLIPGS